jgi:UDP-GlcNAc:undecaprenyl-phosphate GlcNAc-1-phosphate transferase
MQILQAITALFGCLFLLGLLLRQPGRLPIDRPNDRSLHTQPVPRIGGLGVIGGIGMAVLLSWQLDVAVLLFAVFSLAMLSALDDVWGLPVWLRLTVHVAVAGAFLYVEGMDVGWLMAAAALTMVWMANLYNFMDGADGLAGGMAAIGFGTLGLAAELAGEQALAGLCLATAAAALAFLRFNFPPARLFMGDAGSIPLGFLGAGAGWMGWQAGAWPIAFPLLVFSPFILDASVTLLRRALRGEKVWLAHKEHYYQRLVRMGWTHRKLALSEYALMAAAGITALILLLEVDPLVVLLPWAVIYLILALWVEGKWHVYLRGIGR